MGTKSLYSEYCDFFSSQIMKIGSMNVLRKYIWHLNEGCIADAFGPFIHIGFAAEVGCPIGLAHAFAALSSSYNYLGDLPAATYAPFLRYIYVLTDIILHIGLTNVMIDPHFMKCCAELGLLKK